MSFVNQKALGLIQEYENIFIDESSVNSPLLVSLHKYIELINKECLPENTDSLFRIADYFDRLNKRLILKSKRWQSDRKTVELIDSIVCWLTAKSANLRTASRIELIYFTRSYVKWLKSDEHFSEDVQDNVVYFKKAG
jgi:hypothetical protein